MMIYKHESGIHIDCLTKNINSYQLIEPKEAGAGNIEFVLGKHSGKTAVKTFFSDRNIILSQAETNKILTSVKEWAFMLGRGLEPHELINIYREMPLVSLEKNKGSSGL